MTPSVGCSAVLLNGLKFLAVMSPAATVIEASFAVAWPPVAAPEQAPSVRAVAVTAATALTRRRSRGRFVEFRSMGGFLSGHAGTAPNAVLGTRHPAPAREAGR